MPIQVLLGLLEREHRQLRRSSLLRIIKGRFADAVARSAAICALSALARKHVRVEDPA